MRSKSGTAKTGCLKELMTRKKTGQGVTGSVESLKMMSLWKLDDKGFSTHLELNENGLDSMRQGYPQSKLRKQLLS